MAVQTVHNSVDTSNPLQHWLRHHGESIMTYTAFVVMVLIIGVPFYYIFVSSITPTTELFQIPPSYWPSSPTFANYVRMSESVPYFTYFRNSLIFAIGSSGVSVA